MTTVCEICYGEIEMHSPKPEEPPGIVVLSLWGKCLAACKREKEPGHPPLEDVWAHLPGSPIERLQLVARRLTEALERRRGTPTQPDPLAH